jgi:hypothetical protein
MIKSWQTTPEQQQPPVQDATVEEIRLFVRRLKKRWPDLCIDCKSVIRETLS